MADVQELRALINAATPSRPWEVYPLTRAGRGYGIGYVTTDGYKEGICEDSFMSVADAALIAGAVNALPELLDEVERLDSEVSDWVSTYERQCTRSIATIRKLEADIRDLRLANPTATKMIAMQKELARLQSFVARTVENAQLKVERLQLDVAAIEIERDALRAEVERLRARECPKCGGSGGVLMEATP